MIVIENNMQKLLKIGKNRKKSEVENNVRLVNKINP